MMAGEGSREACNTCVTSMSRALELGAARCGCLQSMSLWPHLLSRAGELLLQLLLPLLCRRHGRVGCLELQRTVGSFML